MILFVNLTMDLKVQKEIIIKELNSSNNELLIRSIYELLQEIKIKQ